jgi:hypothetical protein
MPRAVYRPASAALLSELTPAHRQVMIFAIYRSVMNLGTTAAPIGAALISVSYNLLFWGEAGAALAYAVIALVALPASAVAAVAGSETGRADTAAEADPDATAETGAVRQPSTGYLAAHGGVIALNAMIVITCELLMTKLVQRWPPRAVVMAGFALPGGGMAAYTLPWGAAIFVIGTLVWSLAEIVAGLTMSGPGAVLDAARQARRSASGRGRPVRRGPRCELDRADLDPPLHVLDPPVVRSDGLLIHRGENDPPKVGVDVLTGGHQVAGARREVLGVESGERVDVGEYLRIPPDPGDRGGDDNAAHVQDQLVTLGELTVHPVRHGAKYVIGASGQPGYHLVTAARNCARQSPVHSTWIRSGQVDGAQALLDLREFTGVRTRPPQGHAAISPRCAQHRPQGGIDRPGLRA